MERNPTRSEQDAKGAVPPPLCAALRERQKKQSIERFGVSIGSFPQNSYISSPDLKSSFFFLQSITTWKYVYDVQAFLAMQILMVYSIFSCQGTFWI